MNYNLKLCTTRPKSWADVLMNCRNFGPNDLPPFVLPLISWKSAGKPVVYHVLKVYGHGLAWTRQTMTQQLSLISAT